MKPRNRSSRTWSIAAFALLLLTGPSLRAQPSDEHAVALLRLHAIANEELAVALKSFVESERAVLAARKIELLVRPAEASECSALGGLGFSTTTNDTIRVTLCAFPLLALAQSSFGMLHLITPPITSQRDLGSMIRSYWDYQVNRYAYSQAAAVLSKPELARPWCMGFHAAWMIAQGRPPSDCESISEAERASALADGRRFIELTGLTAATEDDLVRELSHVYMTFYRNAVRFVLAHELGHIVDKDATPENAEILSRLNPEFTMSTLAELNADWYGLNALSTTYAPTFAVFLELYWSSLRKLTPVGLPMEIEIIGRMAAIRSTSGCRRGGYDALNEWAEKNTNLPKESVDVMREYHGQQCKITRAIEQRTDQSSGQPR
jgi:hypothetical protein